MPPRKKEKTAKNYEFLGLGFPVIFSAVELRWIADEWLPNINMRKLMDHAFETLIDHPAWLTGAQVAFIRKYMSLSQEDFAKGLGLTTHAQVSRWEKKGQDVAGLSPAHEANLRVLMRGFLGLDTLLVQEHIRLLSGALMDPKGPIRLKAA
jgi:DNA-binding transcriptional regulator YiaG